MGRAEQLWAISEKTHTSQARASTFSRSRVVAALPATHEAGRGALKSVFDLGLYGFFAPSPACVPEAHA